MGVKIRGIYTTALTRLCVDHNLAIVLPSKQAKERFRDYKKIDSPEPVSVEIRDLEDQQGILLRGERILISLHDLAVCYLVLL